MKNIFVATAIALTALGGLSACTTTEKGAIGGAAAGAIAGQLIGGDTKATLIGAGIGAVGGAVAGEVIGRQANGNCVYQKADGSQYLARCPS